MPGPLLAVSDCSFSYGAGQFRLQGISLEVLPGQVLGIVGPNGSGKSTLLRLMGGLLEADAGAVTMDGRRVCSVGRRRLARQLAFLPQSPGTEFRFSVREVVAMGRYPYQRALGFLSKEDIEVVERALRETGSERLAERSFSTLSGGEKQRVLVAGILAQEPAVMLLDEPTAALDIHHQAAVFDLLWRLSRKGIGMVAVTHDLNAAGRFCDRLALLDGGRLARLGSPQEVLRQELLSRVYGDEVRVSHSTLTDSPLVVVPGRAAHREGGPQ